MAPGGLLYLSRVTTRAARTPGFGWALLVCAVAPAAGVELPYWSGGELVARAAEAGSPEAASAPDGAAALEQRIRTLLFPPPGLAVDRLLPEAGRVESLFVAPPDLVVRLELPAEFLQGGGVTDELLERLSRQLLFGLEPWPELRRLHLVTRDPLDPGGRRRTLASFLSVAAPDWLEKAPDEAATAPAPLVRRQAPPAGGGEAPQSAGALDGKVVYVSQAHGFLDYETVGWATQRGLAHGIVEDFVDAEAVDQYLLRYLRQAGAQVFTLRESDLNPAMVIVDDGDGAGTPGNGTYVESGAAAAFSASGLRGFRNFQAPYASNQNPFDSGGSDRLIATATTETARATWTPTLPADGDYDVAVSYSHAGAARASDAHFIVRHTGGETHLRVNQQRHGWVWVHLGRFRFRAGSHPEEGSVALANDSALPGPSVAADAVRFGGGLGDVRGPYHATTSGRPRWEEGARSYTQFLGAPASVWSGGDVAARSRYAAWENIAGVEDSIYLSWHSNAFNGTARGTSSYVYSDNPPDGSYDPDQSVPGSAELMNRIHDEIVHDARAGWDAAWTDRGYYSAYFGEINPAYNPEMPSALLEVAFHDNAADAAALAHPRFRRLLARAIYQGIVRYFAARDALPADLLPEPPREVEVHATGPTSAAVTWLPSPTDGVGLVGDPATGYRVYRSRDGRGFDAGTATAATSLALGGLAPGETLYLRVTATNAGGESLPSETLALRTPVGDEPTLLLVAGFDRLDRGLLVSQQEPALGGAVLRMFLDRMNRSDYLVEHAEAARGLLAAVDSAANEAVASGRVPLDPALYRGLLWQLGEESTADETLSAVEQERIQDYLEGGGQLMITGAETAWDLDYLGSAADRTFYRGVLRSRYLADDAATYRVVAAPGGIFDGLGALDFDDGTHGTYDVEFADELAAEAGAAACLAYDSDALAAGVAADSGVYRVVNLGLPFETLHPASARAALLERVGEYFGIARRPEIFADGFEIGDTRRWSSGLGQLDRPDSVAGGAGGQP